MFSVVCSAQMSCLCAVSSWIVRLRGFCSLRLPLSPASYAVQVCGLTVSINQSENPEMEKEEMDKTSLMY